MIPEKQVAVQLVGPDELVLNTEKEVHKPGPHQILGKVESVGLCFSDMKLLHAFTGHPRKGPIIEGIDQEILKEIPSYVPNELPTVPGHEAVVEIVAVGEGVKNYKIGERYLVQTDYRHLPTDGSKAAFGYNFEGALQQYVLMDERVITAPDGESFLIPVTEEPSASAVALVEPWACVEDAYVTRERQTISGNVLIVKEGGDYDLQGLFSNKPKSVMAVGLNDKEKAQIESELGSLKPVYADEIPEGLFEDIIYLGVTKETFESLEKTRLAERGIMNVATAGRKFGEPVMIDVGRIHYEGTRFIGTSGNKPADSYKYIPATGEIPDESEILIVGAAGPMGTMHVIRSLSLTKAPKNIIATDINNDRMAILEKTVKSLADKKGTPFILYNPKERGNYQGKADYAIYLVPAHQLLPPVIHNLKCCGKLNIFAGIRAGSFAPIDMDYYVENSLYMIGTSGSTLEDMRIVLGKVDQNVMDTNTSVAAISGMKGAIEGLRGVDSQRFHGKVIVYPQIPEMDLIELEKLPEIMPDVASFLNNGVWTKEAESALIKKFS
ncbi:TPA: alcohol dehydrogenase [bacterium]|nr:alcohol dehydrogenase [bacterium]